MRFHVEMERLATETQTFIVEAASAEEAEEILSFDGADDPRVLHASKEGWESEGTEYTVTAVEPGGAHEITPLSLNSGVSECVECGLRVRWTGKRVNDPENDTGSTIPGPWVHLEQIVEECDACGADVVEGLTHDCPVLGTEVRVTRA